MQTNFLRSIPIRTGIAEGIPPQLETADKIPDLLNVDGALDSIPEVKAFLEHQVSASDIICFTKPWGLHSHSTDMYGRGFRRRRKRSTRLPITIGSEEQLLALATDAAGDAELTGAHFYGQPIEEIVAGAVRLAKVRAELLRDELERLYTSPANSRAPEQEDRLDFLIWLKVLTNGTFIFSDIPLGLHIGHGDQHIVELISPEHPNPKRKHALDISRLGFSPSEFVRYYNCQDAIQSRITQLASKTLEVMHPFWRDPQLPEGARICPVLTFEFEEQVIPLLLDDELRFDEHSMRFNLTDVFDFARFRDFLEQLQRDTGIKIHFTLSLHYFNDPLRRLAWYETILAELGDYVGLIGHPDQQGRAASTEELALWALSGATAASFYNYGYFSSQQYKEMRELKGEALAQAIETARISSQTIPYKAEEWCPSAAETEPDKKNLSLAEIAELYGKPLELNTKYSQRDLLKALNDDTFRNLLVIDPECKARRWKNIKPEHILSLTDAGIVYLAIKGSILDDTILAPLAARQKLRFMIGSDRHIDEDFDVRETPTGRRNRRIQQLIQQWVLEKLGSYGVTRRRIANFDLS